METDRRLPDLVMTFQFFQGLQDTLATAFHGKPLQK
jgi:hypothetical protein